MQNNVWLNQQCFINPTLVNQDDFTVNDNVQIKEASLYTMCQCASATSEAHKKKPC